MSSFYLLSDKIQKIIWDMKWDTFTEIQERAVPIIVNTRKDVVLSSPTASGKTEAAFLPILSSIEKTGQEELKVLYISPLKALINNQFERISDLTKSMDIKVTKWHGDASQSKKKKFMQNPSGILQITPESIESLFVNRSSYLYKVFGDIEYIIIDEIHSFIGTARGVQLRSLISRIEEYCQVPPRKIGLSATLSNYQYIKEWLDPLCTENVEIISSEGSEKELFYSLVHFLESDKHKIPLELFEDLRAVTRDQKALIFCNSRGDVEETTVVLNRLSTKEFGIESYLAHHSSIDKKEREYVEKTMASAKTPKSVVATSSLELGIDIGSLDLVVQIDSTFTVSSLKQRLGRSGRQRDSAQYLQLYTTSDHSLLQSVAVMELLLDGWVEPSEAYAMPFDILFHQLLSICNQKNGLTQEDLFERVRSIKIFDCISNELLQEMIENMVNNDYLEFINGVEEYIVGLEGDRLMRHWDYYSVFLTTPEYEVVYNNKKIGKLDKSGIYNTGDNIILAGKLWKIKSIDFNKNKIYVIPASDAKKPRYQSGISKLHARIPEKIHEILCSDVSYDYLSSSAKDSLQDLQQVYHYNNISKRDRVVWKDNVETYFNSYTGSKVANTFLWMFRALGYSSVTLEDRFGTFKFLENIDISLVLNDIKVREWNVKELIKFTRANEMFISKYSSLISEELWYGMHFANETDINGVKEFANKYCIVTI